MGYPIILIIFFSLSSLVQAQDLKQFQWKNRVIVLFGNEKDTLLIKQRDLLTSDTIELEERNIKLIYAGKGLYKKLNLAKGFLGIVLLGKDGELKLKEPFIINPAKIYALIDGMPMRKAEIRRKKH